MRNALFGAIGFVLLALTPAHAGCWPQFGTNGADTMTAAPSCDAVLVGLGGDDILIGGPGNDVLWGDACTAAEAGGQDPKTCDDGADTLIGGGGYNIFAFNTAAESNARHTDVIADFVQGNDAIGLGGPCWKHKAFICTFIGPSDFTGVPGQVRYKINYPPARFWNGKIIVTKTDVPARKLLREIKRNGVAYTTVEADLDGDGQPDFTLVLIGVFNLTPDDFLLNTFPPARR